MWKSVLVIYFLVHYELKDILSKPTGDVSYIEGVNFQYKDDKWTCGDVECPAETFGCKILIKTQEQDKKELLQSFNCIDKQKNTVLAAGDKIDLPKERKIEIDLETYVGAESVYSTGYGYGGHETAKGIIAADALSNLKEYARLSKKMTEDLYVS